MLREKLKGEKRTVEQLEEHYTVEKELANRLKNSTKNERTENKLYTSVYNELFRKVSHHPQLAKKSSKEDLEYEVKWQYGLIGKYLNKDTTLLEVGPGTCHLAFEACKRVKKVYGVDVSNVITDASSTPDNFELIISDGSSIPLPDATVDVVFSNSLMEHIHPDDAQEQLNEIYRVLREGGCYVCITPNKVNGPWDISYYFDEEAAGFHLKEYTMQELLDLFRSVGFRRFRAYAGAKGYYVRFPIAPILWIERALEKLPPVKRTKLGRNLLLKSILGVKLVGIK